MNMKRISLKVVTRRNICMYAAVAGAILACLAVTSRAQITATGMTSSEVNVSSYAEDRALIEDLQARYMFALDFRDLDKYIATFTEDGILDIGEGEWRGRETIRKIIESMPRPEDPPAGKDSTKSYPPAGRHSITNIVIKIDGNKASGRAYWFYMSNDNPERNATLGCYGHYEDEMVKVNGTWLFSKRKIYNEQNSRWIGPAENPGW
jgi:hypothetical protein